MRTHIAIPKQLTTALLFGALIGAWLLFAPIQLGGQASFVIVNGNSMEPLYHKGDLVIIRAEPSYGVGDIVTYRHPDIGPVIHRIIGRDGERWVFKGDNNDFIDPYHPLTSELIGRAWIFAPSVGKLLVLVRTSPLLIAVVLGGGVIVMMLSPQTKEGKTRQGKRGRPAGQPTSTAFRTSVVGSVTNDERRTTNRADAFVAGRSSLVSRTPNQLLKPCTSSGGSAREWALTLLGVLAMASLALAGFAFTRPVSQDVTDSLSYRQQGSLSYSADAPPGLYDAGSVQSGEPVFRDLSRALSVDFDYQFASDEPADLSGSYDLTAVLSTQSGWKRTIVLAEPQPFSGRQIAAHGEIALRQLNDLAAQFQEQTGLLRQQYILSIIPYVSVEGTLGGVPLHDSFAPKLEFRLDEFQLQMISSGDGKDVLRPEQEGMLKRTRSEPSTISPLGLTLNVALARQGGLIVAVVSLALAAVAGLPLLRAGGQSEQARIQMRYGSQIVDLAGQPDMQAAHVVRIGSINDLAKLAERQGALILRDGSTQPPRYIVQDGTAAYIYGEFEPAEADLPTADEQAEPQAQPPAAQPWQDRFLLALRETGLAAEACHSVGIDMVTAYRERERSTEFAKAWNDARLTAWQQHTLKGQAR
ncbi:signal peptidase I [Chloroflexales bacterium ZM16-3]|nr:signal peptidase I [Chloroflexales bacterium ZM16-3]